MSDVNFSIVHLGKTRYWAGVSTCGHILLDERLGLYDDDGVPDLSWIEKSTWGEMLEPIDAAMENPCYGNLVIDFDQRKITDSTGAGYPFDLKMDWLAMTWMLPSLAPVSKKSLQGHLKAQRLTFIEAHLMTDETLMGESVPRTLPKAIAAYEAKTFRHGWIARFGLPRGWTYLAV